MRGFRKIENLILHKLFFVKTRAENSEFEILTFFETLIFKIQDAFGYQRIRFLNDCDDVGLGKIGY